MWRLLSTAEVVKYIKAITLVLWKDSFSTMEFAHCSRGITLHVGGELHHCGVYSALHGDDICTCGNIVLVLWKLFSPSAVLNSLHSTDNIPRCTVAILLMY